MESAASVELERSLRQYERHLIGLFSVVILQPNFRRALPESTKSIVKRKEKAISAFACWAADPGIENIADSAETILFILKLSLLGYNGNRNIDITSGKDGRLHHTYTG